MQLKFGFEEPDVTVAQATKPTGYAGLYGFHKYWGKKPYEPLAYAIQQLSNEGDIVVDPFVGSGTAAREAMIRGRRFIGFDVSPLAVRLSRFVVSPPNRESIRKAFDHLKKNVQGRIDSTYRLELGEHATHYLWDADELTQVWIKGTAKHARREISPTEHDLSLIKQFADYRSGLIKSPQFFSNGRINASPEMTLTTLLTPRAQHNIDLLIGAIQECPTECHEALTLCLTAASGQMTRMVFAVSGRGKTTGRISEKVEVGSWVIGYWRPKRHFEVNVWNCYENRVRKLLSALKNTGESKPIRFVEAACDVFETQNSCYIGATDCRQGLRQMPDNSCSLVITDPPHSDRVPYLELSAFWNAILGEEPCFEDEIVVSNAKERAKSDYQYHTSMIEVLCESARILTDRGSLVMFFNAAESNAWEFIREFMRSTINHGLVYAGRFPCRYSANSVVQDNRKGAMKYDWALVFQRDSTAAKTEYPVSQSLELIPGWCTELPDILIGWE